MSILLRELGKKLSKAIGPPTLARTYSLGLHKHSILASRTQKLVILEGNMWQDCVRDSITDTDFPILVAKMLLKDG